MGPKPSLSASPLVESNFSVWHFLPTWHLPNVMEVQIQEIPASTTGELQSGKELCHALDFKCQHYWLLYFVQNQAVVSTGGISDIPEVSVDDQQERMRGEHVWLHS